MRGAEGIAARWTPRRQVASAAHLPANISVAPLPARRPSPRRPATRRGAPAHRNARNSTRDRDAPRCARRAAGLRDRRERGAGRAHVERRGDEGLRQHHRGRREGDVERLGPEEPAPPEGQEQRQPGDRRRDHDGQLRDGVDETRGARPAARDPPRQRGAEDHQHHQAHAGREQTQQQRRDRDGCESPVAGLRDRGHEHRHVAARDPNSAREQRHAPKGAVASGGRAGHGPEPGRGEAACPSSDSSSATNGWCLVCGAPSARPPIGGYHVKKGGDGDRLHLGLALASCGTPRRRRPSRARPWPAPEPLSSRDTPGQDPGLEVCATCRATAE